MTEYELRNFIVSVVRQTLAPIMLGEQVSNESNLYGVAKNQGKAGPVDVRNVLPYGVASRAPPKTPALLVPIAGDPSHMNTVGHADEGRPDVEDGEIALYSADGQLVYVSNGKIQVGSKASDENMVLGKKFVEEFLKPFLTSYLAHTHIGNLGYDTAPPTNAAEVEQLKSSPVSDNAILSDVAFTEKG